MDKKLKIAFTHVGLNVRGGAERKLLLIARHLNTLPGVDLEIFVNQFDADKTFKEYLPNLKITKIEAGGLVKKFFSLFTMAKLTENFDLIHAHNHPAHLAAAISKYYKTKPILWFDNEPLLYLEGTRRRNPWWKLFILRMFEKFFLPQIDIIVANSRNTANNIKRFLKRDTEIIYSGVDTKQLRPAQNQKTRERIRCCVVSRFSKEKNINFLLRLAEEFPAFDFTIGGGGRDAEEQKTEQEMREWIMTKKLANTDILIVKEDQHKIDLYQNSDIFIFPTLNEPLGINVVEAMSCGLPVVAFNSGGARETVVNKETGFLVETEEEFKEKVKFLAENPELRKKMGFAGRQRVLENFSLEQMVNKTIALYKKLLEKYGKQELASLLKEM